MRLLGRSRRGGSPSVTRRARRRGAGGQACQRAAARQWRKLTIVTIPRPRSRRCPLSGRLVAILKLPYAGGPYHAGSSGPELRPGTGNSLRVPWAKVTVHITGKPGQARPGQTTGSHIWSLSLMRTHPCWRVGRHWHVPSMFPASTRFATSESRERGGHAMDWRCTAPTSAAACSSLQPSLSPSPSPTCAAFFYNLDLSDGSAGATDRRGRAARERECLIGRRRGNRRSTRRQVPLASSNEQF
jgi:hypothetical protein